MMIRSISLAGQALEEKYCEFDLGLIYCHLLEYELQSSNLLSIANCANCSRVSFFMIELIIEILCLCIPVIILLP